MRRVVALLMLGVSGAAGAVETVRISMGHEGAVVALSASGMESGRDVEDSPFTPLSSPRAVFRNVEGRLEMNGAPVGEGTIRLRASPVDAILTVGKAMKVRGDVVVRAEGQ